MVKKVVGNKTKKILTVAAPLLTIAALARYILNNTEVVGALGAIRWNAFIILVILSLLVSSVSALMTKIAADFLGVRLSLPDWLGTNFLQSLLNQISPLKFGSVLTAAYYKENNKLPYSQFIAIYSGIALINIICIASQFAVCLFCYWFISAGRIDLNPLVYVFIIVFFLCLFAALYAAKKYRDVIIKKLPKKWNIRLMVESFVNLLLTPRLFLKLLACCLSSIFIQVVRMYFCYAYLGIPVNLLNIVVYVGILGVLSYLTVLPGNIGINEAVMGFSNVLLGDGFDAGFTVSVLARLAGFAAMLFGSLLFALPLYKRLAPVIRSKNAD